VVILQWVLVQNILSFYRQWYQYWTTIKIPTLFTNIGTHTAAVAAATAAQWLSQSISHIRREGHGKTTN